MDNIKIIDKLYNLLSNTYPSEGFNTLITNLKLFENKLINGTDNRDEMNSYLYQLIVDEIEESDIPILNEQLRLLYFENLPISLAAKRTKKITKKRTKKGTKKRTKKRTKTGTKKRTKKRTKK